MQHRSFRGGTRHEQARASADRTSARDRIIEAYLGLLCEEPTQEKVTVSAVAKGGGLLSRHVLLLLRPSTARRRALDDLAPKSAAHIARALMEGDEATIPAQVRARMLLIAKIAGHTHASAIIWRGCSRIVALRVRHRRRDNGKGRQKRYSISWRRVRPASFASIWQTPRAQTNSMRPFPPLRAPSGRAPLYYARERELVAQTG